MAVEIAGPLLDPPAGNHAVGQRLGLQLVQLQHKLLLSPPSLRQHFHFVFAEGADGVRVEELLLAEDARGERGAFGEGGTGWSCLVVLVEVLEVFVDVS